MTAALSFFWAPFFDTVSQAVMGSPLWIGPGSARSPFFSGGLPR